MKPVHNPKLILFDIDGTLIKHIGTSHPGHYRYARAIQEVFGVSGDISQTFYQYNGLVDRQTVWLLVKPQGVSRETFEEKFPLFSQALHKYAQLQSQGKSIYILIPEAQTLVEDLKSKPNVHLGILTGNVEKIAWWKLEHAGFTQFTDFGLFGDEVDDRVALAKSAFLKAEKHFGIRFTPTNIVVIGDTVYDIRCGKAIGAKTIAVTTGGHDSRPLKLEKPDLLVDALTDKKVYGFLGI